MDTQNRIWKWTRLTGLVALTVAILVWRRPGQFFHPYVWVEEGIQFIPDFMAHGWRSVFIPVAGYLVIPSKLIFAVAASVSFNHMTVISYWLTIAFTALVVSSIAFSPTYLRWPGLCAICVLIVPTDPEVFAVTEYAFWWGTLLGVVSLLWREDGSTRLVVRCLLVLVGGLSSPLIVPMTALFAIRAAWLRKRSDVVVLAVASVVSVIQLGVMHFAAASVAGKSAAINFKALVARMLGEFVFWSRHSGSEDKPFLLGIVITATLVVFVVTRKKWRDPGFVLVAGCYAIAVTASLARMPILSIHPALGGPRYFFFPYIFLSWMLVFAMGEGRKWIRGPAAFLLACSAIQFIRVGQRDQMDLLWSEQIEQCKSAQEDYALPVHYDGTEHHWYATLNSEDCQSMSDRSLLD